MSFKNTPWAQNGILADLRKKEYEMKLRESIKRHEGFESEPYRCSAGVLTIGYGFALRDLSEPEILTWAGGDKRLAEKIAADIAAGDTGDLYMTRILADEILELKIAKIKKAVYSKWQFIAYTSPALQNAVCEWVYQLGLAGVSKFVKTWDLIKRGEYAAAADEAMNSAWAVQTPARAKALRDVLLAEQAGSNG